MDSGKQGVSCSETSSEENDRSEQTIRDENSGTRRSYECTYCKRGFTNAQALGGHMNIHRKDRAKAKQHSSVSSLSNYHRNEETPMAAAGAHPFSANFSPFSSQFPAWYQPSSQHHEEPSHHHHNTYFQTMNYESDHYNPFDFSRTSNSLTMSTTRDSNMNDELLGANLSLQIDTSDLEDHETTRASVIDDEVDLELRLGHG